MKLFFVDDLNFLRSCIKNECETVVKVRVVAKKTVLPLVRFCTENLVPRVKSRELGFLYEKSLGVRCQTPQEPKEVLFGLKDKAIIGIPSLANSLKNKRIKKWLVVTVEHVSIA